MMDSPKYAVCMTSITGIVVLASCRYLMFAHLDPQGTDWRDVKAKLQGLLRSKRPVTLRVHLAQRPLDAFGFKNTDFQQLSDLDCKDLFV